MTDTDRHERRPVDEPSLLPTSGESSQSSGHVVAGDLFDPSERLPLRLVAVFAVAWLAAIAWLMTISPAVPDSTPPPSTLDVIVQSAMLGSWFAVITGIATRRRFLLGATVIGGAILAGAALLCLATGHTGLWIAAQVGAGVGLASLGYGASRIA